MSLSASAFLVSSSSILASSAVTSCGAAGFEEHPFRAFYRARLPQLRDHPRLAPGVRDSADARRPAAHVLSVQRRELPVRRPDRGPTRAEGAQQGARRASGCLSGADAARCSPSFRCSRRRPWRPPAGSAACGVQHARYSGAGQRRKPGGARDKGGNPATCGVDQEEAVGGLSLAELSHPNRAQTEQIQPPNHD